MPSMPVLDATSYRDLSIVERRSRVAACSPQRQNKAQTSLWLIAATAIALYGAVDARNQVAIADVTDTNAQTTPKKIPPPDVDKIKQAESTINDLYGSKLIHPNKLLGAQLLQLAQESKADIPGQYVLLHKTIEIGAATGDSQTVYRAVDELAARFDVNEFPLWIEAFESLSKRIDVSEKISAIIDRASQADDYESAATLANLWLTSTRNLKNMAANKIATAKAKEIVNVRDAFRKTTAAREKLAIGPTDPEANRIVGYFLCFVKRDWDKGTPMLALGDDKSLKALAILELKDGKIPAEMVSLGDDWAKIGRKDRAVYWYKQAIPSESGLVKARLEKAVATAEGAAMADNENGHAKISVDSLKKVFHGKVAYNQKTEEVELTYNWTAPKNQTLDFDLMGAKPTVEQNALVIHGGESIRHVAEFDEVTVLAQIFVPVMKGSLISTSGGAAASVGGGNPDTMYLGDGQSHVYFVVPEADRTGVKSIRLTVSPARLGFDYGKYTLGKPETAFHAGRVTLFGGEAGFKFSTVVIVGKLNADWVSKSLAGKH